MISLVAIFAGALTPVASAASSRMSARTTSGNDAGLSSGEVCNSGDVGYYPGDKDEALFNTSDCILDILVLVVILRMLRLAAMLLGGTATAVLVWARERRLTFRAGQYIQSTVLL
ncbi:unnamed protein product [Ectocarpus sp. 4 AP-2014]